MISLKQLKKIKIFEMLPEAALTELAGVLYEEKYKKSDFIIHRNEPGRCMYFLLSGKVRIRVPDKADLIMDEGSFFGEMALISGAPRGADVIADTDVRLLILTKQQFETELSSRPLFSRLLTQVFADRLGSPADELTEKNLGKYRIHTEIGRGAMGVIYYGTHLSLEMPVAIKMLSHRFVFDTTSLRKFLNEAKIIAGLSHKNIRSVIDIEQAYGTYFIIMEYIEGIPLDQLIIHRQSLTYPLCREIIYQIAAGLTHAHARGVVHRDIKPGNILISSQGEVKITDFGIAFADNENLKNMDTLSLGTPYYAAPEQIKGEPVDHQADIYSFGVLCYNLLTGKMPFEGSDPLMVFSKHLNEEYIPPEELAHDLPLDLAALIKRCLEKDKRKRLHSLHNLQEISQIWAFGEGMADSVHQAMNDLEIVNYQLSPKDILVKKIQQIRKAKHEHTSAPQANSKPADMTQPAMFAIQPGKAEDDTLFEFNLDLNTAVPGQNREKQQETDAVFMQLILQEKRRQELLLIQNLIHRFMQIRNAEAFCKIIAAVFEQILNEDVFSLLIPGAEGEFIPGNYYFKTASYKLPAVTEAQLLEKVSAAREVVMQEEGAQHLIALPLFTGDKLPGTLIICKAAGFTQYSGIDFFRELMAAFSVIRF